MAPNGASYRIYSTFSKKLPRAIAPSASRADIRARRPARSSLSKYQGAEPISTTRRQAPVRRQSFDESERLARPGASLASGNDMLRADTAALAVARPLGAPCAAAGGAHVINDYAGIFRSTYWPSLHTATEHWFPVAMREQSTPPQLPVPQVPSGLRCSVRQHEEPVQIS